MAASRIPAPRTSPDALPRPTPARSAGGRRRHDLPPAQLGSLTQRDHRVGAGCAACGSAHVTRLSMSLTDGTPVDFTSCHRCEHRTWQHAGGDLGVEAVLDHARKR